MLPRPIAAGLILASTLSLLPTAMEAQLGGIAKRARDRIGAGTGQQVSTDQAARLPGPTLTADVVNRLLTGLVAEKQARDRAAEAEARRQRQAEAAAQARRQQQEQYENHQQCVEAKLKADPKYAEAERVTGEAKAAAQGGDMAKAMQLSQRIQPLMLEAQQRAEAACAATQPSAAAAPTPEEEAIQATSDSSEVLGAGAGKFTPVEYGQVKELVYTYLSYPQKAGLTAEEKGVVDPKRRELKDALKAVGLQ